jgi:hypothetical protein
LLFCEQEVWGVLWELDREHLDTLDRQEGVPRIYNRMKVQVSRQEGVPRIYNRMKVQVSRQDGMSRIYNRMKVQVSRQEGVPRIYNRMNVQVKLAGGRAQDLQQDESQGKAGRRACPGSTTG